MGSLIGDAQALTTSLARAPGMWGRHLSWARARGVVFWACTLLVAFEMIAGGVWDLLRVEYVRVTLAHLGYPLYLLPVLGVAKIPCALALLLPRVLRLKEWAYAGAFFTYAGAVASHGLRGDGQALWLPPLVLAALTLASWGLRPARRRLGSGAAPRANDARVRTWAVPLLVAAAFLALAFATVPVGPPPALSGP